MELQGIYLRAMQDISARLMNALPAEESLWQILSQTEALLMEAQMTHADLHQVFGAGGVAAFCQSIVDEYNQARIGEKRDTPAAHDPSIRTVPKASEPRGGVNYHRKRRMTIALITTFFLVFVFLAIWYTGLLRFWVQGSAYYLDELYHFSNTITHVDEEPMTLPVMPLSPVADWNYILHVDGNGDAMVLTDISYMERLQKVDNDAADDEENAIYKKNIVWCVRIRYPVHAGYTKITYTEPGTVGTATLRLPNGEVITSAVTPHSSGSDGRGYGYTMLEILELPETLLTEGGEVTVVLEPPRTVEWKRVSLGWR